MKRLRGIIFKGIVVLSLVLFVITAVLWVFVLIAPQINVYDITLGNGTNELHLKPSAPIWIAPMLFAILPGLYGHRWIRSRIARRRRLNVRCTNCGYDLRATPGRCPECGKTDNSARMIRMLSRETVRRQQ